MQNPLGMYPYMDMFRVFFKDDILLNMRDMKYVSFDQPNHIFSLQLTV